MPHAESDMASTQVNGTKPNSLFIQHLISYPVVSDSYTLFSENAYGKKSISLADSGYSTFVKPVTPYLERPYSYLSPYVARADELADSGLSEVDKRFPVVTEPTEQIKEKVTALAGTPLKYAGDSKDYVFKIYGDEYNKRGGEKGGVLTPVTASVTTFLVLTIDVLATVSSYLAGKKEQTKEVVQEKANNH
jgi:hypothetical protein